MSLARIPRAAASLSAVALALTVFSALQTDAATAVSQAPPAAPAEPAPAAPPAPSGALNKCKPESTVLKARARRVSASPGLTSRYWKRNSVQVTETSFNVNKRRVRIIQPAFSKNGHKPVRLAKRVKGRAMMTGDYFTWGAPLRIPVGPVVHRGVVQHAPWTHDRAYLAFDARGNVHTGLTGSNGKVSAYWDKKWRSKYSVGAVNPIAPKKSTTIAVYTPEQWAGKRAKGQYEVLVRKGRIIKKGGKITGRPGDKILSGTGSAARRLRHLPKRARVKVTLSLDLPRGMQEVIGRGSMLLRDGAIVSDCHVRGRETPTGRSVFAWSPKAHKGAMITVVAVGSHTSDRTHGATHRQAALIAKRLGYTHAVMFDGSFSASQVTRSSTAAYRPISGVNPKRTLTNALYVE